jgi:hypothetical protein
MVCQLLMSHATVAKYKNIELMIMNNNDFYSKKIKKKIKKYKI